jgi:uncharacterized protein
VPRRWASTEPALAAALALALVVACGGDPPVVLDPAGLLTPEERSGIAAQHALLLRDFDVDYRIEIVSDIGDLSRHAAARFAELDVGSRSRAGHGLLLLLDLERDRVRLEVGQRLEGVFTDAFVAYLEERQMVPFFRADRVADGILAATELVVTHVERSGPIDGSGSSHSAGGGAARPAGLGAGPEERFRSGPEVDARGTPEATLEAYLAAMRGRNGSAALDLYTEASRAMLAGRVVTAGQMDAIAAAYRRCHAEATRISQDGSRAVVRYPAGERACAPWFLVREDDRWRLDLVTSRDTIRFGARNAWRFAPAPGDDYVFAFSDWRLDRNGFPHAD